VRTERRRELPELDRRLEKLAVEVLTVPGEQMPRSPPRTGPEKIVTNSEPVRGKMLDRHLVAD